MGHLLLLADEGQVSVVVGLTLRRMGSVDATHERKGGGIARGRGGGGAAHGRGGGGIALEQGGDNASEQCRRGRDNARE